MIQNHYSPKGDGSRSKRESRGETNYLCSSQLKFTEKLGISRLGYVRVFCCDVVFLSSRSTPSARTAGKGEIDNKVRGKMDFAMFYRARKKPRLDPIPLGHLDSSGRVISREEERTRHDCGKEREEEISAFSSIPAHFLGQNLARYKFLFPPSDGL